jgi:hypothetical protein
MALGNPAYANSVAVRTRLLEVLGHDGISTGAAVSAT